MLKREGIKKGVYILPNLLTLGGLFCGFFAIIRALKGEFEVAAWAIFAGGVLDGLDGRVARLTRTQSDFGIELDSLADLTTFGLAPALVAYLWDLSGFNKIGWGVCFVYVACGALRLARYNVQFSNEEKRHFQGLPIPLAAYVLSSYIIFNEGAPIDGSGFFLGLVLAVSLLMVSQIPYRSFKNIDLRNRHSFVYLIVVIGVLALVSVSHQAIFILALAYVIVGLLEAAVKSQKTWRARLRLVSLLFENMRVERLEELDHLLREKREPFLQRAARSLRGKKLRSEDEDEEAGETMVGGERGSDPHKEIFH